VTTCNGGVEPLLRPCPQLAASFIPLSCAGNSLTGLFSLRIVRNTQLARGNRAHQVLRSMEAYPQLNAHEWKRPHIAKAGGTRLQSRNLNQRNDEMPLTGDRE
jgi:hypothetical protein